MSPTPTSYNNYINTEGFQKKKRCSCFSSSNILRPVNKGDFFHFWCYFAANFHRLCRCGPYDMKTFVWLWRKSHYNSSHFGTKQQFRSNKYPLGFRLPKCLLASMLFYTTSGLPSFLITPRCERKSKIVQINGRKESVYCDSKKKETARSLSKSSCSGSTHDFPPTPLLFNRKCNIPAFALINSLL